MTTLLNSARPVLKVLRLSRFPILFQLNLEEALLRGTKDNWLIINDGAFAPAIVMGISGKPDELINVREAAESGIQVIKRFTGGGTVVVDSDTLFTTLIVEGAAAPHVPCFPQHIMRFTEQVYDGVFGEYGQFRLRENDYVFDERKFGGNAQAITGRRWLHHTSLLWDFEPERMALLKHPRKAPQYREGRSHESFITCLKEHVSDRNQLVADLASVVPFYLNQLAAQGAAAASAAATGSGTAADLAAEAAAEDLSALAAFGFDVQEASLMEASAAMMKKTLQGNKVIDLVEHLERASAVAEAAAK